jgi:orotidine-5'-phosphate decarboxylase
MGDIRESLCINLDVDDIVAAERLARAVRPYFGVAKVGFELFAAAGPPIVGALIDIGYRVFLDLKFYDIPTTVERAARVVGALGATYLNMHAAGGPVMLRAGVEGLSAGAAGAGLEPPIAVGVTILTSDADAPRPLFEERMAAVVQGGCGGVVCAASDVPDVHRLAPGLVTLVPGLRAAGGDVHDQARSATPQEALAVGVDVLLIGRMVTAAAEPVAAAARLMESLEPAR